MTNEELMPRAKAGDIEAIQALYDNNIGIMHKLIFRLSISKQDRDDFLQECYFVLLKCIDAFEPEKGFKFITYLSKAITRMIWRKTNDEKQQPQTVSIYDSVSNDTDGIELIDTLRDPAAEEFIDNLDWSYFQSEVQSVLVEIEQPCRALVFENKGKGLTVKYLAHKYGLTERDAQNHICRTELKLRRNRRLKEIGIDYGIIKLHKRRYKTIEELMGEVKADREWLQNRQQSSNAFEHI